MSNTLDFENLDFENLDDINALLAGGGEKGRYREDMLDFIASGKMGTSYPYSGKKAQSVKTGFESAIEAIQKDTEQTEEVKNAAKEVAVKVRKSPKKNEDGTPVLNADNTPAFDELVFLIRTDLVRARKAEQAQAA
jgi:hypothetical protein